MKKRTKSQRIGSRGENAFRHAASVLRLLPTKVEEDFGIDFLCQVETDPKRGDTEIIGSLVGVAVRGTISSRGRIRLNRSDVETLLNCNFPVLIALVHIGVSPENDLVYFRLIDPNEAVELAEFLATDTKHISFTPNSFRPLAETQELIRSACEHGFSERVRLALVKHGLTSVLPNARLEICRTSTGQISLILVGNFLSQFDATAPSAKEQLNAALFGSESQIDRRLREVPLRKEIWSSIQRLPQPVLITGPLVSRDAILIVDGSSARCKCTLRQGIDYMGITHPSGFSLRISKAQAHEGIMVHYINAVTDPDTPVTHSDHQDLWNFLADCVPSKRWNVEGWGGKGFSLEESGNLYRFAWLAYYLQQTENVLSWPSSAWRLSDGESEEALNALALATLAVAQPDLLTGLTVSLIDPNQGEKMPAELSIPACSNLPGRGLVLWIDAEGGAIITNNQIAGVKVGKILNVTSEFTDATFRKSSSQPELVIRSGWHTVSFGPKMELTESDASTWGYETRIFRQDSHL